VRKIRSIWSFITRRKAGSSSGRTNPPGSPSGTWYFTLDLKLDKFISICCDGDLSLLIISGKPRIQDLAQAWESIHEQFLDAMKDKDGLYKLKLMAKINRLEFDYELIQLCLKYLRVAYNPRVVEHLTKLVHVEALDPEDRSGYMLILQTVDNRSQRLRIDLEDKQSEYAILHEKDKNGKSPATHQHFSNLIGQVSRYMKFHVNRKETTTGEFVSYYVMMKEEHDAIQFENAKIKR